MEKYLVIILIIVVGYVMWKCLTETKEGFGDAVTVDAVDDNNAINILAKIAKDLQDGGGLKVKGNLETAGKILFKNKDGSDDSDPYYLEKFQKGGNQNSLRLTINDDADESFQIWGNSCAAGNCGGEGTAQHVFWANGNADHAGNLNVRGAFNLLPRGVILAWNGAPNTIPAGWLLCNGQNGTPDLRNRFIVGSGDQYATGNTGGANEVTLNTSQIPSHTHTHWHRGRGCRDGSFSGKSGCWMAGPEETTETTNPTGGGQAHENRPPYYALAWIMKA